MLLQTTSSTIQRRWLSYATGRHPSRPTSTMTWDPVRQLPTVLSLPDCLTLHRPISTMARHSRRSLPPRSSTSTEHPSQPVVVPQTMPTGRSHPSLPTCCRAHVTPSPAAQTASCSSMSHSPSPTPRPPSPSTPSTATRQTTTSSAVVSRLHPSAPSLTSIIISSVRAATAMSPSTSSHPLQPPLRSTNSGTVRPRLSPSACSVSMSTRQDRPKPTSPSSKAVSPSAMPSTPTSPPAVPPQLPATSSARLSVRKYPSS